MYVFIPKNKHLASFTEDQIKSKEYRFLTGMKAGKKIHDPLTGRKTHQDYLYEEEEGNLRLAIRQFYEDVLDDQGKFIDIKVITHWFKSDGGKTIKIERLRLDYDLIVEIEIKRRSKIKSDIIKEARESEEPFIKDVFSFILNWLDVDLSTWIDTGDASFFHKALDNASTESNQNVIDLFQGVPDTPISFSELLLSTTSTQINVIGYLKYYIN